MNKSDNWLSQLANDDVWAEKLDSIPSMIVFSYLQLKNLAQEGQVYGVMLILKDIYEMLLKIPIVMSLVLISNNEEQKGNHDYVDIIQATLSSPLSMGQWREIAKTIKRSEVSSVPNCIIDILDKTIELYDLKVATNANVVNWRNDKIGHGAVKFEYDLSYQEEIRVLIYNLKQYFDSDEDYSILGLYDEVYFSLSEEKLVGANFQFSYEKKDIYLHVQDQTFRVENYANNLDLELYLFNSYYARKGVTHFSSYFDGDNRIVYNDYFDNLYRKYVYANLTDANINSRYVKRRDDNPLIYLNSPPDYIRPEFLIDQLKKHIKSTKKGIIAIQMERGTGKSAFSNKMSGYSNSKSLIKDCFSRCYHVSHANLRGINDFVNRLNFEFRSFFDSDDDYVTGIEEIPTLSLETISPDKDMSRFLNFYHRVYQDDYKYTILIIDGIDEITDKTSKILEFIPSTEYLDEGVFIILMSRFSDENTVLGSSKLYIEEGKKLASNEIISIRRDNKENEKLMCAFVRKYNRKKEISDEEIMDLVRKSDRRFLYLKAYLEVEEKYLDNADENAFIKSYLEYVLSFYGSIQKKRFIRLAVYIALFSHFSIDNYQENLAFEDLTYEIVGFLNDLMPLLSVFHTDGKIEYEFSDLEYTDYILNTYPDMAVNIINSLSEITTHLLAETEDIKYYDRLVYYSNCFVEIWNKTSKHTRIRNVFYKNSVMFFLENHLEGNEKTQYGEGNYAYKELKNCINDIFIYGIQHNKEIDINNFMSIIFKDIFSQKRELVKGEYLFALTEDEGIQALYRYFLNNTPNIVDATYWFWVLEIHAYSHTISRHSVQDNHYYVEKDRNEKSIEEIIKCITKNGLCIKFTDYLKNRHPSLYLFDWLEDILEYNPSYEEEKYVLNTLLELLLIFDYKDFMTSYLGRDDFIISRIIRCINQMEEKGCEIDRSIKEMVGFQDIRELATSGKLRDVLTSKLLDQAVGILEKGVGIELERGDRDCIGKAYFVTSKYDNGSVLKKALFERLRNEKEKGNLRFFIEKMGSIYYILSEALFQHFIESKDSLGEIKDWLKYIKENYYSGSFLNVQFDYNDNGLIQIVSDLIYASIIVLEVNKKEKEALQLLEEYVYVVDSKAFFLDYFLQEHFDEMPSFENDGSFVYCTNNAFYLMDVYYRNNQNEELVKLIKRIEETILVVNNWSIKYDIHIKRLNDMFLYKFLFIRKEMNYSDEFDPSFERIVEEHKELIFKQINNLSPQIEYLDLKFHIREYMVYIWEMQDFKLGTSFCDFYINRLKVKIEENESNTVFKNSLKNIKGLFEFYRGMFDSLGKIPLAERDNNCLLMIRLCLGEIEETFESGWIPASSVGGVTIELKHSSCKWWDNRLPIDHIDSIIEDQYL